MKVCGVWLEKYEWNHVDPKWCSNDCGSLARWQGRNGLYLCSEAVCLGQARELQRDCDANAAQSSPDEFFDGGPLFHGMPDRRVS